MASSPYDRTNSSTSSGSYGSTGSGTLRDASSTLRDASSSTGTSGDMMSDYSEKVNELYQRAGDLLQGNAGKVVGAVALAAAVGFIGYMLGRSSAQSSASSTEIRHY